MKKLLNRPEALLAAFGLLFLAGAILIGAFWDNTPQGSEVIYVSDRDKDRLTSDGDGYADSLIVNINTATQEELMQIDGIGEATAERIVEYRETNNGFKSIDELTNIKGIGKATLENLRPYITAD